MPKSLGLRSVMSLLLLKLVFSLPLGWKLLDFAELKHSSISFFDIEKHEMAALRLSRARTRAAKVGKGLSKDQKARKLALQHWLEAIDPRHRYGHNVQIFTTSDGLTARANNLCLLVSFWVRNVLSF